MKVARCSKKLHVGTCEVCVAFERDMRRANAENRLTVFCVCPNEDYSGSKEWVCAQHGKQVLGTKVLR